MKLNTFENENYKEAFLIVSAIAPQCVDAIQYMDDSRWRMWQGY